MIIRTTHLILKYSHFVVLTISIELVDFQNRMWGVSVVCMLISHWKFKIVVPQFFSSKHISNVFMMAYSTFLVYRDWIDKSNASSLIWYPTSYAYKISLIYIISTIRTSNHQLNIRIVYSRTHNRLCKEFCQLYTIVLQLP